MKKLLMACALILSLSVLGGCSKDDDGPSSGDSGKVKGNVKVDGKSFDVKYGYTFEDDWGRQFLFYDIDIMKYVGQEAPNVDMSGLFFFVEDDAQESGIGIVYKSNAYKETGYYYDGPLDVELISYKDGTFKSSCNSVTVYGGLDNDGDDFKKCSASYSVEGKVKDMTGAGIFDDDEDDYTRSVSVTEVTDAKQIAFLKSLTSRFNKVAKAK